MAISFEFKYAMNSGVLAYGVHRIVTVHGGLRILEITATHRGADDGDNPVPISAVDAYERKLVT